MKIYKRLHAQTIPDGVITGYKHGASQTPECFEYAVSNALASKHFDIARFILTEDNTIEADRLGNSLYNFARSGDTEMVKWALPLPQAAKVAGWMNEAAAVGDLALVQRTHGNVKDDNRASTVMDSAAENGHLDVVKWLHANRTEVSTLVAMGRAAMQGSFDITLYLHANRLSKRTEHTTRCAMSYSQLEIFQWIFANYPESVDSDAIEPSYTWDYVGLLIKQSRRQQSLSSS